VGYAAGEFGMKIQVKIGSVFAIGRTRALQERLGSGKDLEISLQAGTSIGQLLQRLPFLGPPDAYDDMMLHVFVNGIQRGFDHILQRGDRIDLHIPSSGG
jgi:molybdopterin converting factor small subunit